MTTRRALTQGLLPNTVFARAPQPGCWPPAPSRRPRSTMRWPALDPEPVSEVLRLFGSLDVEGMTLLMVTHGMSCARKALGRPVFMHAGHIYEVGPPEQIA